MKEYGLYQGETPQAPQLQHQGSNFAPQVDTSTWGNMLDGAIKQGVDTVLTYAEIKDEEERQRVEAEQRAVENQQQLEYEKRLNLPWGDEKSFYDRSGNLNQDSVNAFIGDWQQKIEDVGGSFWLRKFGTQYDTAKQSIMDDIASKVKLQLTRQEIQNAKIAFQDNHELALKQGDTKGAINSIMGAVKRGIITEAKGRSMMLDINKKNIMENAQHGSLSLGGKTYLGDSAMLAAAKEKAGQLGETKAFMLGEPGTPEYLMNAVNDSGIGFYALNDKEQAELIGKVSPVVSIQSNETDRGKKEYNVLPSADNTSKAVASNASQRGMISYQDAMAMVARIAADQFSSNDNMTTEQGVALFNGSEIFSVLGNGDEEVGKAKVRSIMQDVKERLRGGSKISLEEAEKIIKGQVRANQGRIGQGTDWENYSDWAEFAKVERMQAWVNQNGGIDDGLYKGVRHIILPIYDKYREEYLNASKKTEERKKRAGEELMEWAGDFIKWYGKEVGNEAKERSMELAESVYLAKWLNQGIAEMANKGADAVLRESYGADHARLQNVLKSPINTGDGISADEAKKMLANRKHFSESFKKKASSDYEKLRESKERVKETEKLEKEEEQARKKREREEEKKRQKDEEIKLYHKRSQIQQTDWEWDDNDTSGQDIPCCTLPKAEYERVINDLGYTGEKDLYILTRHAKILVGGVNDGESIKFNTSATMKLQGKLKKGQSPVWQGNLAYKYEF